MCQSMVPNWLGPNTQDNLANDLTSFEEDAYNHWAEKRVQAKTKAKGGAKVMKNMRQGYQQEVKRQGCTTTRPTQALLLYRPPMVHLGV